MLQLAKPNTNNYTGKQQQTNLIIQELNKNPLTKRKRGGDPIKITIGRVQNQKLPTGQNFNRVGLNSKFAPIKHSLHSIATLELHQRTASNRYIKFSPYTQTHQIKTKKRNEKNNTDSPEIYTCFGRGFE